MATMAMDMMRTMELTPDELEEVDASFDLVEPAYVLVYRNKSLSHDGRKTRVVSCVKAEVQDRFLRMIFGQEREFTSVVVFLIDGDGNEVTRALRIPACCVLDTPPDIHTARAIIEKNRTLFRHFTPVFETGKNMHLLYERLLFKVGRGGGGGGKKRRDDLNLNLNLNLNSNKGKARDVDRPSSGGSGPKDPPLNLAKTESYDSNASYTDETEFPFAGVDRMNIQDFLKDRGFDLRTSAGARDKVARKDTPEDTSEDIFNVSPAEGKEPAQEGRKEVLPDAFRSKSVKEFLKPTTITPTPLATSQSSRAISPPPESVTRTPVTLSHRSESVMTGHPRSMANHSENVMTGYSKSVTGYSENADGRSRSVAGYSESVTNHPESVMTGYSRSMANHSESVMPGYSESMMSGHSESVTNHPESVTNHPESVMTGHSESIASHPNPESDLMSVPVETGPGRKFTLEVDPTDTVLQLKEKIFHSRGYPPYTQRLVFNGVALEDDMKLADCEVTADSTLVLWLLIGDGKYRQESLM